MRVSRRAVSWACNQCRTACRAGRLRRRSEITSHFF
jgi:hypothetical protein